MADLRIALVGAGFWARYQLAAWREVPGVRCVAVCDLDQEKARSVAETAGITLTYTDAEEMLDRERPDLLDIVTNAAGHAALVRLAARKRVPVVCQKPMAVTLGECTELVDLCRQAGVPFAIHENWRWQAPLRRVKELITEGAVGTPFRCRIDVISGFDVFANQPYLKDQPEFIVGDMGCHLFDLARSYFGEAQRIFCQSMRVHRDIRGEDAATVVLTMNGGRTTVTVNMAFAGTPLEQECFPQTAVFVEGDRGSIEVAPELLGAAHDGRGYARSPRAAAKLPLGESRLRRGSQQHRLLPRGHHSGPPRWRPPRDERLGESSNHASGVRGLRVGPRGTGDRHRSFPSVVDESAIITIGTRLRRHDCPCMPSASTSGSPSISSERGLANRSGCSPRRSA